MFENMTWLDRILHIIATIVGLVGIAVIIWGVLLAVIAIVRNERTRSKGIEAKERGALRRDLSYYLLLGLEFLVAADIINTLINPDLEHILVLGAIVIIRTIISISLQWEMSKQE